METRKVQLSGGTTYTVSLPKPWAQEQGIEAGSVLYLHPDEDGTLHIESTAQRNTTRRSVSVGIESDDTERIRETINALYGLGFDEIALTDSTGHPSECRRTISSTVETLSGLEVRETTETTIVLQSLIDADNVAIRKNVLRLHLIMLAMHQDAVTAIVDNDNDLAQQVIERDNEADRLFAMVRRHFRRALMDLREVEKLGHSRAELFELYHVTRQFERVADHAVKIAKFAVRQPAAPSDWFTDEFAVVAACALDIVDAASDVILTGTDIKTAYDAITDHDDLSSELETFKRELYDHETAVEMQYLDLLLDSVNRTAEYGVNVAEMAIQQRLRE
jgi:phosphate uptake regulator